MKLQWKYHIVRLSNYLYRLKSQALQVYDIHSHKRCYIYLQARALEVVTGDKVKLSVTNLDVTETEKEIQKEVSYNKLFHH